MKKLLFLILFMCLSAQAFAVDTKLSALTADANPTSDDLVYVVDNPGGTPASRQVTVGNLFGRSNNAWQAYFDAASLQANNSSAFAPLEKYTGATASMDIMVASYDRAMVQYRNFKFQVPNGITGGCCFKTVAHARTAPGVTKNLVWAVQTKDIGSGVAFDGAYSTFKAPVSATGTTQSADVVTTWCDTTANLGFVSGDEVIGRVYRDSADANDTMDAGTASGDSVLLHGLGIACNRA